SGATNLWLVPDRRAPGALLHSHWQRAIGAGTRLLVFLYLIAIALIYAAGWIFEQTHIVECALAGTEVGIAPDRAQRIASVSMDLTAVGIHARVVPRVASDLIDLLESRSRVGVEPAFDDLDLLERRPGVKRGTRILEGSHHEGGGRRIRRCS